MINRRFVPIYFDLFPRGFASDPDARKFVVARRKQLGGRGVPTPPVLLMNAKGDIVGEAGAYASPDQVLAAMRNVLKKNPQYNQMTDAEKNLKSPIDRAEVLIDLLRYDEARKLLAKVDSQKAHYLMGRLARYGKDWTTMEKHFANAKDPSLADDIKMERAYKFWLTKKFAALKKHLDDFPRNSNRYTEARYYEGLALHMLGKNNEALKTWQSTIQGCLQDPWIYRADWAYTNVKQGRRGFFSAAGPRTSPLNRIGYMGRRNPDLKGP